MKEIIGNVLMVLFCLAGLVFFGGVISINLPGHYAFVDTSITVMLTSAGIQEIMGH